jgi:hypothetical protein
MTTKKHHPIKALATAAVLKVFADKISARIQEGVSLDQLEAKAKAKNNAAAVSAIERLKIAKQNISQKLQDLNTTHMSNVSRAQADIDEDVARLNAEIAELSTKLSQK